MDFKLSLEEQFKRSNKSNFATKDNYAASRGEYLNGIIMANYLGYQFIDAANVICLMKMENSIQKRLMKYVQKARCYRMLYFAFYGAMPNGKVKTFSKRWF